MVVRRVKEDDFGLGKERRMEAVVVRKAEGSVVVLS